MKIKIIAIGKTQKSFLIEGEQEYLSRLKKYIKIDRQVIPDVKHAKNKTIEQIKEEEGKLIMEAIEPGGNVVLLDEKGQQMGSKQFATWLQGQFNRGGKHITFVIGGPYGFSEEVYKMAQKKLSLSKMTFSHQMIRMFFLEQLYRGFTILRNEPYHHE